MSKYLNRCLGFRYSVIPIAVYVKYEPGNNLACSAGVGGCSSAKRYTGYSFRSISFGSLLVALINMLRQFCSFLNRYAFSYIALYGKPMIKNRGIDALVNECLIGPVLTMGATFIAYVCALLAYLYLIFTSPAYNSSDTYTLVVVAFAFLIGLQICNIFTTPIDSGIDTIFVASAWDPEELMRDHPDLYGRMVAVYPHQQSIHA
ncbi:plasma-membrane choline transporter-domain-containing protein [Cenococcum geophilum]